MRRMINVKTNKFMKQYDTMLDDEGKRLIYSDLLRRVLLFVDLVQTSDDVNVKEVKNIFYEYFD